MKKRFIINFIVAMIMSLTLEACMNVSTEKCMYEAEVVNGKVYSYPYREHRQPTAPKYVKDAKNICWDMADIPQNSLLDQKTLEMEKGLAQQCSSMLKSYKKDYPADTKHVESMKAICERMTHQQINLH
jgi:hypothetical protein